MEENRKRKLTYTNVFLSLLLSCIFIFLMEVYWDCSVYTCHPYLTFLLSISIIPLIFLIFFTRFAYIASVCGLVGTIGVIIFLYMHSNEVSFYFVSEDEDAFYLGFMDETVGEIHRRRVLPFLANRVSIFLFGPETNFDDQQSNRPSISKDAVKTSFESELERNLNLFHTRKMNKKLFFIRLSTEINVDVKSLADLKIIGEVLNSYYYSKIIYNCVFLIEMKGSNQLEKAGFGRKIYRLPKRI